MNYLDFLNKMNSANLAVNQARVLLYINDNPECHQKDMVNKLTMSRAVLSQCCVALMNKGFIYQEGSYIKKTHSMTKKGETLIDLITNENN